MFLVIIIPFKTIHVKLMMSLGQNKVFVYKDWVAVLAGRNTGPSKFLLLEASLIAVVWSTTSLASSVPCQAQDRIRNFRRPPPQV